MRNQIRESQFQEGFQFSFLFFAWHFIYLFLLVGGTTESSELGLRSDIDRCWLGSSLSPRDHEQEATGEHRRRKTIQVVFFILLHTVMCH